MDRNTDRTPRRKKVIASTMKTYERENEGPGNRMSERGEDATPLGD